MSEFDEFDTIDRMLNEEYIDVLQEFIFLELGLFLFAMLSIGVFVSLAIYSRSWSVPAVVAIFTISAGVTVLPHTIIQVLTQGILLVTIALAYYAFKRR